MSHKTVIVWLAVQLSVCLFPDQGRPANELRPASALPEQPRLYIDTTDVMPSGEKLVVPKGGNFQAALNRAKPGDVIVLEAGAAFKGPFTLPNKQGEGRIVIRSSASDSGLPPQGLRVSPAYADAMPKLTATSGSVIQTEPGAHHYRFVGVEIRPEAGVFLFNLVRLGNDETSASQLPHDIIFDRCYIHGDPVKGSRQGIVMNSKNIAVIDSYLSDFKDVGSEAQAILGWNGPGPFKIVNNYLEGAGENVMFGGGQDPGIPGLVPSDIEVRRNHFSKPLSWKKGDPSYGGTAWMVKNIFELKNARRVLIEGNLFENNWVQAQRGFAILFTVRNQNGSAPWTVVEDVTFRNNIVRHTASGVSILGRDDNYPSGQTKRILIQNNLFDDIGGDRWGGGGRLFQLLRGTQDIVIDHNTAFQTEDILLADGEAHRGFVFRNNIVPHNEYGVYGNAIGVGLPSLNYYFPGFVFEGNVIVGGKEESPYPPRNSYPGSFKAVGFVDRGRGDYRLSDSSPYRKTGTDDKRPGVDFDALSEAMGSTLSQPVRSGIETR
jgi:hypothetical protein